MHDHVATRGRRRHRRRVAAQAFVAAGLILLALAGFRVPFPGDGSAWDRVMVPLLCGVAGLTLLGNGIAWLRALRWDPDARLPRSWRR